MNSRKTEKEKALDHLWRGKEEIRNQFLATDLRELGDAVFLNGCWTFRPNAPFSEGTPLKDLGVTDKEISEISSSERKQIISEAVAAKNREIEERLTANRSEIDSVFRVLNKSWEKFCELWPNVSEDSGEFNPQLANTRRIVRVNDLLGHAGREPRVIIESLLSKTWIALLAGASKSNKSWLSLQLAIAVSKGEDWLGFQCRPSRVLYIDYELSLHSLRGRLLTLGLKRELPNHGPDFLILKGGGDEKQIKRILRLLKESQIRSKGDEVEGDEVEGEEVEEDGDNDGFSSIHDLYDLIILDPLYMLLGKHDENNAKDMVNVFNEIRELQSATGAAILINTHFRKGARDYRTASTDRISGSGVFTRYPDLIMTLERLDEGVNQKLKEKLKNRYRMDFTIRHLKAPEPRGLEFHPVSCRFSTKPDEAKLGRDVVEVKTSRRGRKSKSDKLILEAMKRNAKKINEMPLAKAVPVVADAAGVGKSTVYRFLKNKKRYVYKRGNKLIVDMSDYEKMR